MSRATSRTGTSGAIIAGTAALVRREWRAMLAWSLVSLALGLASSAAYRPVARAMLAGGPMPSPALLALGYGLFLLAAVALYTAGFRAALLPGERHAAYLRIGMDELRVLAVAVTLYVGLMLAMVPLTFVATLIAVAVAWAGIDPAVSGICLAATVALLLLRATIRLSLALPMTVLRRRIMLGPAWRLTKGRVLPLAGAYAAGGVAILIPSLLLVAPLLGPALARIGDPGAPGAAERMTALQIELLARTPDAAMLALQAAGALLGGLMVAVLGGMPGVATARLLAEQAEAEIRDDEFRA